MHFLGRLAPPYPTSDLMISRSDFQQFNRVRLVLTIYTLSLAGTRHFAILHGTRGGGYDPPRVWLLSELELRLKNQRVASYRVGTAHFPT